MMRSCASTPLNHENDTKSESQKLQEDPREASMMHSVIIWVATIAVFFLDSV